MGLRLPRDRVILLGVIEVPNVAELDRLHSIEGMDGDLAVSDLEHGATEGVQVTISLDVPDVLNGTDQFVEFVGDHPDHHDVRDTEVPLLSTFRLDRELELLLIEAGDLSGERAAFSFHRHHHHERTIVRALEAIDDIKTVRSSLHVHVLFPYPDCIGISKAFWP